MDYPAICPYCTTEFRLDDMDVENFKHVTGRQCHSCNKVFEIEAEISVKIRVATNCEMNNQDHKFNCQKFGNKFIYECRECDVAGVDTDEKPKPRFRRQVVVAQ